ncbi:hypothetical protein FRC02_011980 [Tulasnella sp. 418]|nr:hypothetical protein FRC02_011980 [Tulasnella sp. 418]
MAVTDIAAVISGDNPVAALQTLVARTYVLKYCVVACYCWMLFDWTLTIESEFCTSFWWILGIGSLVLVFIVEIILQGRVYAMYRCDQRLLALNFILFLTAIGSTAVVFARQLPHIQTVQAPAPLTGCWGIVQSDIWIMWFPCFMMELWLWLLVIFKAKIHARRYAVDERKAVLTLLIRDSVAWFAVMSFFMCWNMLAFRFAEDGWNFLGVPFMHTAACIGGSRMILNMREAYYTDNVHPVRPQAGPLGIAYDLGALGYVQESRRYTMGSSKVNTVDSPKYSYQEEEHPAIELGEHISRDPILISGRKTASIELMVGAQPRIDIAVVIEKEVTVEG